MSFRAFIFYCALSGGWAALIGWALGRAFSFGGPVPQAGARGLFLGMLVALALSVVDGVWNLSLKEMRQLAPRACAALAVGCFGGLFGGVVGQSLYGATGNNGLFFIFGWTITGLLIGVSIGAFEMVASLVGGQDATGARRKVINGLLGGGAGGILGGTLALLLKLFWEAVLSDKDESRLWLPTAWGFVALGASIGLLIGLAQVILKEAWVRVEQGFKAGREMILTKERTTIGRAESCDIGLFGDTAVEKLHARILLVKGRYLLESVSDASVLLNEQDVEDRVSLSEGDRIRIGGSVLLFRERRKRG